MLLFSNCYQLGSGLRKQLKTFSKLLSTLSCCWFISCLFYPIEWFKTTLIIWGKSFKIVNVRYLSKDQVITWCKNFIQIQFSSRSELYQFLLLMFICCYVSMKGEIYFHSDQCLVLSRLFLFNFHSVSIWKMDGNEIEITDFNFLVHNIFPKNINVSNSVNWIRLHEG